MTKDGFEVIGRPTTVKFGFKHSNREKKRNNEVWEWEDDVVTQDQSFFGQTTE